MGRFLDRLTNLVSNLGTSRDKSYYSSFAIPCLTDVQLEAMYRGSWLSRKVVDLPVADAVRPWRSWEAEDKQIEAIERAEKRHAIRAKVARAVQWARLHGGSAIYIGADVANPLEELNLKRVGKGGLQYLNVIPRSMVTIEAVDTNPASPTFGQPIAVQVVSPQGGSVPVHPSRLILLQGCERPDPQLNQTWWGDSILQLVYSAVHDASLATASVANLLHEAKVDVIRSPDLGSQLSSEAGTRALTERWQNANLLKSINNTLLLDAAEEYERKQITFANLDRVVEGFLKVVSGASDIPVTKLLGMSPAGMNATGESDTRNYYDALDGLRENTLRPVIERLDELLWRDETGQPPPADAYWTYEPLWQMTAIEKADLAKKKAETTEIYMNLGVFQDEFWSKVVPNQLVEDEVYPGMEAAVAEFQSLLTPQEEPEPAPAAGGAPARKPNGGR